MSHRKQLALVNVGAILTGVGAIRTGRWREQAKLGSQLVGCLVTGPAVHAARRRHRSRLRIAGKRRGQRPGIERRRWRRARLYVACLARRLVLAPLGPSVLKPHLHPGLAQVQLNGQLLAGEHVRIRCTFEGSLKFLQLVGSKGGSETRISKIDGELKA